MTADKETLLFLAKQGDAAARETVIAENSKLIWSVVRRYFGRGTESEDLFQLGCIGFLKAIDGFDSAFGTQFSTYAVPKIAGEIRRFLRDDGSVKVSRALKEKAAKIAVCRDTLMQKLGRDPTVGELASETGLDTEEIAVCETALLPPDSLQRETAEGGLCLEELLCDSGQEEKLLESLALRQALEKLPRREQMVLRLRYFRGMTQQGAAKILGISQVQVSRIERRGINALKNSLT